MYGEATQESDEPTSPPEKILSTEEYVQMHPIFPWEIAAQQRGRSRALAGALANSPPQFLFMSAASSPDTTVSPPRPRVTRVFPDSDIWNVSSPLFSKCSDDELHEDEGAGRFSLGFDSGVDFEKFLEKRDEAENPKIRFRSRSGSRSRSPPDTPIQKQLEDEEQIEERNEFLDDLLNEIVQVKQESHKSTEEIIEDLIKELNGKLEAI
ncbi:unnamed protein product [Ambrosiozyma monospora]|uniref:Unnamed protein product n=1 Tax=Ambrosiozyma monospora TaxID=43982 RepID=A0A9W6SUY5_AMBMO|nr:unnamed protein product [Ambrosiozyma monospora]